MTNAQAALIAAASYMGPDHDATTGGVLDVADDFLRWLDTTDVERRLVRDESTQLPSDISPAITSHGGNE